MWRGSLSQDKLKKARAPFLGGTNARAFCEMRLGLAQEFFNDCITRRERFAEFFRLRTAAFGHVCFAAAFASDDRGELANHFAGRNAIE